jgi:hypothetical protein
MQIDHDLWGGGENSNTINTVTKSILGIITATFRAAMTGISLDLDSVLLVWSRRLERRD